MKNIISGLAILSILSLVGCMTPSDARMSKVADAAYILYKEGERAYKLKNYEASRDNYQEFVDRFPGDTLHRIALYYLGRSHELTNDINAARDTYNLVLEQYADSFWADSAKKRLLAIK